MARDARGSAQDSGERLGSLELQAVLEALVDPVLVIDERDMIVQVNPAAVAFLGFDPHGIDRSELTRRLSPRHPDGSPFTPGELPSFRAEKGEPATATLIALTLAGEERWVVASASAFAAEGRRRGVVLTFHDVSEREDLLAGMRDAVRLMSALNRINAKIDSDLDVDSIMHAVLVEAAEALGAQRGALAVPEGGRWIARYLLGAPPGVRWVPVPEAEHRYIAAVAESPEPFVVEDTLEDPRISRDAVEREHIRAVVAFRLETHGELVGVVRLSFSEPIRFGPVQRDFVGKLAAAVSLGLRNARLLASERAVSEKLQAALLTVPKRVRGLRCGTLYRSASETARVGGDFYDLFELRPGLAAVVIGDVSGKGIEAAAMTSLVKNTLRAYAEEGHGPDAVMAKTNRVVVGTSEPEQFVTLFFGLLETASGALTYASGGHPPPLLKTRDGVTVLETPSPFVGAFEASTFVAQQATLGEGDVLLLYTDGVTEARCTDGLLGEERLVAFVRSLPPTPASRMPDAVLGFVTECTGGPLSDDLAMLSIALAG